MRLTYWCCASLDDSSAYNIRTKTKKEASAIRDEDDPYRVRYSDPFKVTVEYSDGLDLLRMCLGEGGIAEYPDD